MSEPRDMREVAADACDEADRLRSQLEATEKKALYLGQRMDEYRDELGRRTEQLEAAQASVARELHWQARAEAAEKRAQEAEARFREASADGGYRVSWVDRDGEENAAESLVLEFNRLRSRCAELERALEAHVCALCQNFGRIKLESGVVDCAERDCVTRRRALGASK